MARQPMTGTEAGSRPHALIELLSLRYFKNTKVKDGRINTGIRSAGLSADNFRPADISPTVQLCTAFSWMNKYDLSLLKLS